MCISLSPISIYPLPFCIYPSKYFRKNILIFICILYDLYICVSICMSQAWGCPQRTEEDVRSLVPAVTSSCEAPNVGDWNRQQGFVEIAQGSRVHTSLLRWSCLKHPYRTAYKLPTSISLVSSTFFWPCKHLLVMLIHLINTHTYT